MATSNTTDIQIRINTAINSAQTSTSLREMRTSMRELQSLALEVGSTNTAQFNSITNAVGQSRDRINDLNDSIGSISGEPLERLGNSVNQVSSSLSSLDFGGATIGIRSLRENLSGMNFAELGAGLRELGVEFLRLGAIILTNPLFLLGAAIVLIIANFEKLKNAGGLIGDMFSSISNNIKSFLGLITNMTDALGLTNTKLEENKQLTLDILQATKDYNENELDFQKTIESIEETSTLLTDYKLKLSEVDALYAAFNAKYNKGAAGDILVDFLLKYKDAKLAIESLNSKVGETLFITTEEKQAVIKDILEYYKVLGQFNNIYKINAAQLLKDIQEDNRNIITERNDMISNQQKKEIAILENTHKEKKRLDDQEYNRRKKQVEDQEQIRIIQNGRDLEANRQTSIGINTELDKKEKELKKLDKAIEERTNQSIVLAKKLKEGFLDGSQDLAARTYLTNSPEILQDFNRKKEIKEKEIKELKKDNLTTIELQEYFNNEKIRITQKFSGYLEEFEKGYRDREIEQEKKFEQDKLDIHNRFNLKKLNNELDHLEKMNKLRSSEISKSSIANIENSGYRLDKNQRKLDFEEELEGLDKQHNLKNKIYTLEIGLQHDNVDEQQNLRNLQLYDDDEFYQNKLFLYKNFAEKEHNYEEKSAADREKVAKDEIELDKNSIGAKLATFNSRKAINEMEQAMMKQGEERYTFNLGERLKLLKDANKNENEILNGEERKAIMDNALNNTTNAEQRDLEIRQEFAVKREKLEKDSQEARINAATEEANKIYDATKKGLELYSAINAYYDEQEQSNEAQSEEQSEQRAKAKFERNKELQLANAIVNTAAATIFPLIEGNYAGAVFAAALGAVQIATILSTQYKSTGSTTTNPVIAPEAAKPTSAGGNFFGQGFNNQQFNPNDFMNSDYRFQTGNQKVYVLESDITNMINRVAVAQDRNTLRGF